MKNSLKLVVLAGTVSAASFLGAAPALAAPAPTCTKGNDKHCATPAPTNVNHNVSNNVNHNTNYNQNHDTNHNTNHNTNYNTNHDTNYSTNFNRTYNVSYNTTYNRTYDLNNRTFLQRLPILGALLP